MHTRFIVLLGIVSSSVAVLSGQAIQPATPSKINFTQPTASAETVQVTEIVSESQGTNGPGQLKQAGTIAIRLMLPEKYWVEWKDVNQANPPQIYISDGSTAAIITAKKVETQPPPGQLPLPLVGFLKDISRPNITALPAKRDGKDVLLVEKNFGGHSHIEEWFDPTTHLMLRESMFLSWQGKTSEVMRTEYIHWVLNKPLNNSLFHAGKAGTK
jgi:hypothetical protein